jgi:uncharacterized coiled-coil protein SlyX
MPEPTIEERLQSLETRMVALGNVLTSLGTKLENLAAILSKHEQQLAKLSGANLTATRAN